MSFSNLAQENVNATTKQKPARRSERLRNIVAFDYDRNLGGDVGGILVGATKAHQKKAVDAAAAAAGAAAVMHIPDFTFNRVRF